MLPRQAYASLPGFFLGLFVIVLGSGACLFPTNRVNPASAPGSTPKLKVYVVEEGIYEVNAAELEAAGVDRDILDAPSLQLTNRGQSQPFWTEGQGRGFKLRFFAQASHSLYTQENVYWLEFGPDGGKHREIAPGSVPPTPTADFPVPLSELASNTYAATVSLEQNLQYIPQVEAGDHWLWVSMPAPGSFVHEFQLDAVAAGSGLLQVAVWGSTQSEYALDHHLVLSVNGQQVGDDAWDGKGRHTLEVQLPSGLLREGINQVEIIAPGDLDAPIDISILDSIQITYPRRLVSQAGSLEFVSLGGKHQLEGFTGPVSIYDVTHPQSAFKVWDALSEPPVFDGEHGHRYIAVGADGLRHPARLVPVLTAPDLRALSNGADYVAIGPPDLLEPLQPLLEWREAQGLKTMAISIDAVYEQFNYGMPEPQAIREFLRYAAQSWQLAPRYLLLVGDASYDPRSYVAPPEANRLPVYLLPTVFGGETASDAYYAQLDDDLWPDLAVGRLPARRPAQVTYLVAKVLQFEQQSIDGPGRKRILAIADGQEASFRSEAQAFLDSFPAAYLTELYAPDAGVSGASTLIRDRLGQGDLVVAYFGHGSMTTWGKDRLFTSEDVGRLSNADRLPVILNMTCLTGFFTHPNVESLGESFLWQPEGGAVAVLAPTSLTLSSDQSFLSQALVQALVENPQATLGEIFLLALRQVPDSSAGARDVLQTFLLLGDPALRLFPPSP